MDKLKKLFDKNRFVSLKWCFFLYLPLALILSVAGVMLIGHGTNELQFWYREKYSETTSPEDMQDYAVFIDDMGNPVIASLHKGARFDKKHEHIYFIISNAQVLLCPLWVFFCVGFTGVIFYNRELKEPIGILMKASREISENRLDFEVYYYKNNELGALCRAFNEMRNALFENNREMWHSLEERKRLNSAFSHDLRTPLTVLRGYGEFLEKYGSQGKISEEKQQEVLQKMLGQISRLENYTVKMSSISKLEEITPCSRETSVSSLSEQLCKNGEMICKGKSFSFEFPEKGIPSINIDSEILMQVYENILANAARFAKEKITVTAEIDEYIFSLSVTDDGGGFSEEGLRNAKKPFYRDTSASPANSGTDKHHFGLGLYICSVLCEKCGGALYAENGEIDGKTGGKITAVFSIK
ncbi:MAG: HAMP domain-containing histidine kinase [Oscillospiraceae bacterium]|nr:HAMP domain-containing histidine kinase [Oscillospiraceae bacterium]